MAYTDRPQCELMFGTINLVKWADIDNQHVTTNIDNRIAWAIAHAEDYVNARFTLGRYAVPFSSVPKIVTFITSMYSGITLHDFFKMMVRPDKKDEVASVRSQFNKYMHQVLAGQLKLTELLSGAVIETTAYNAPSVAGVYQDAATILYLDQLRIFDPCCNPCNQNIIDGRVV